jgi:midasin (ATPase involved in ribosome maturation)
MNEIKLSKALRNRFTEVWCTAHYEIQDIEAVIYCRLRKETSIEALQCSAVATAFCRFFTYFAGAFGALFRFVSLKELLPAKESCPSCRLQSRAFSSLSFE